MALRASAVVALGPAMIDPQTLGRLDRSALRALYEFVFVPVLAADESRIAGLIPEGFGATDPAALSRALIRELRLGDADEFSADDAAHRAALLPRAALTQLAWRLGLFLGASCLRRLVCREDLAALGDALSDDDWRFVFAQRPVAGDDPCRLADVSPDRLPALLRDAGWSALETACDGLPRDVGVRLRLKLAPAAALPGIAPDAVLAWMRTLYPAVVADGPAADEPSH